MEAGQGEDADQPVDMAIDNTVPGKDAGDAGDAAGGLPAFGGHRVAASRTRTCTIRPDALWCWGGQGGELLQPARVDAITEPLAGIYGGSDDRMCALTAAGAVWCWADGAAPAAVEGLTDVQDLALGGGFTCALIKGGAVKCWGSNLAGQLGDGTQMDRAAPTAVADLDDVVEIGAGAAHTCALDKAGVVSCWGDNSYWQLGDGTSIGRFAPVTVAGLPSTIDRLAVGPRHTCVRAATGQVTCWGFNGAGEASASGAAFLTTPTVFDALGPVDELMAGGFFLWGEYDHAQTCARTRDGSIWCAGRGANGELGDGTLGRDGTDAPIRLSSLGTAVVDLAIGGQHLCALDDRNQVWCWGLNFSRQLGRDTPAAAVPLKLATFGPFSAVETGEDSTCARATNGFYCWGDNTKGQIGASDPMALSPRFVPGPPADAKQWGTGALYTCWMRPTGQVHCMGGKLGKQPVELTALGADNMQLAVGDRHACVVKRDGSLWCWGNSACGFTPTESDPTKMTLFESKNIAVSTGVGLTCAQRSDGMYWCCGDGWGMAPIPSMLVGTDAVEVALSVDGCARKAGGAVLCGLNLRQVVPVTIDGVVQLALSHEATCARKADGSVWCWGKNKRGALGTGGPDSPKPVRIASDVNFVDITGGAQHFCALDGGGRLYCWGDNYVGQLGDGLGGDRPLPALVSFP